MLPSPTKPSAEDIDKHYTTHLPYRNWCPVCVKAKGREDAHRRASGGTSEGLPIVSMDYQEFDDVEGLKNTKAIVAKDEESGAVLSYKVLCKGPNGEWVVKRLVKDIEELGRTDIRLKTDGEPAIVGSSIKGAGIEIQENIAVESTSLQSSKQWRV